MATTTWSNSERSTNVSQQQHWLVLSQDPVYVLDLQDTIDSDDSSVSVKCKYMRSVFIVWWGYTPYMSTLANCKTTQVECFLMLNKNCVQTSRQAYFS